MKVIEKPWGREEVVYIGEKYMVKKLFMKAGHRCSLQYHNIKTETVYMLDGELEFQIGPNKSELRIVTLKPGDNVTILPGQVHRMGGIKDSIYLEASTPEMDDVVRIQDDYTR